MVEMTVGLGWMLTSDRVDMIGLGAIVAVGVLFGFDSVFTSSTFMGTPFCVVVMVDRPGVVFVHKYCDDLKPKVGATDVATACY